MWRHRERAAAAFVAHVEERKRGGASVTAYARRDAAPEPAESEETVRIWRAGERVRVEHHGGERDGSYAITDGPLWWTWDRRMGARSNQDDPRVGGGFGGELRIMLNPVPLLSALRFRATGTSRLADRPTMTARGTPRPQDPDRGPAFELHELGAGAEHYELEVDQERGILLAATAIRDGQCFQRITTTAIRFDQPIPDQTFRFQPPPGEEIQPLHDEHRLRYVTLVEAQLQTPFTVWMPDTVPDSWQVQCRLIKASRRPPSPTSIGVSYHSVDGHESVSLTQAAADASNPYKHLGDDDGWETVSHRGLSMRTRPAHWGQAQVELERDGTFVHLMSDNLTREQLLTIAASLRPAPSTSSIEPAPGG